MSLIELFLAYALLCVVFVLGAIYGDMP